MRPIDMKNDALKNNVWLVTRKPKVNCFTRHHRNSVRYQQTNPPRLSTEAIKLLFKVTLSNSKASYKHHQTEKIFQRVSTLILGALFGRAISKIC